MNNPNLLSQLLLSGLIGGAGTQMPRQPLMGSQFPGAPPSGPMPQRTPPPSPTNPKPTPSPDTKTPMPAPFPQGPKPPSGPMGGMGGMNPVMAMIMQMLRGSQQKPALPSPMPGIPGPVMTGSPTNPSTPAPMPAAPTTTPASPPGMMPQGNPMGGMLQNPMILQLLLSKLLGAGQTPGLANLI